MTTKDSKDPPQSNAPIAISFRQVLSLVGTVFTLKLLHAVAIIFRIGPQENSVRRAINRREKRITTIFLSVIPESLYRSNATEMTDFPSLDVQPTAAATNSTRATTIEEARTNDTIPSDFQSPVMKISSSIFPAIRMSQCFSDRGMGVELFATNSGSAMDSTLPLASSESIYSSTTVRRSVSVNRLHSRSSGVQQGMVVSAAQYAQIASERPRYSLIGRPFTSDAMDQPSLPKDPVTDRAVLELEALEKTRSAESFPGKFPISEGLEFSSLATAPQHIRGRGATSVRPFSDV